MYHYISKIHEHPSIAGIALDASMDVIGISYRLVNGFGKAVKHAIAGTRAKNEIISKIGQFVNVQKQYVFAFFIFKTIHDGMCKF